ncbi:hypothetical protein K469DRAFT_748837 [Zopfia rhizophila CBS 207.26]|uniref:Uncharacterized protein n=1 Tax=Zopfia rhizophila CBS 207.26 TaxID=1314779 RepID=A0A6A6E6V8_9PEZI|nr:hypothetical protein K469DRAFT_748837 [Zopfia rhizophila CBS 207.26]
MAKDDSKKDITRKNLKLHSIYYDEKVYHGYDEPAQRDGCYTLPDHVDAVREALLTFEGIVPQGGWEDHLHDEFMEYGSENIGPAWNLQPPTSAIVCQKKYQRDLRKPGAEWQAAYDILEDYLKVAKVARASLAEAEGGWKHFWRSKMFRISNDEACIQPGYSTVLDAWSLEEDVTWNEFPHLEPQGLWPKGRTQPKPDLTYAFPILGSVSGSPKGFERDEFRQCFSLQVLGELKRNGVFSAPTTGLRRWLESPEGTTLHTTDLSCFPWAVVEMKRHAKVSEDSIERCYCQAANAAAAALALQAQLLETNFSDPFSNLPPVIAFTCIGPIVKVWLMYQTKSNLFGIRQRRMVCIWSTSVQLTWGVAALRAIITNMHIWASRLLKPKIQAWIFQAFRKLPLSTPRKMKTPTTQQTPTTEHPSITLSSSSQINAPSSSNPTFPAIDWTAIFTATSSPSRHQQDGSSVVPQPLPRFMSPTPFPINTVASQHAKRPALMSSALRTFSPELQKDSVSIKYSEVPPNPPIAAGTRGYLRDQTAIQDKESSKAVESNDQVDIDGITRAFESSKIEDSVYDLNDRSNLLGRDGQDSGSKQSSENDSEYVENGETPSQSSAAPTNSSVALSQYRSDEANKENGEDLEDLEFELEDESEGESEDSKDLEFELEDESEGESEDSKDLEFELEDESEGESEDSKDLEFELEDESEGESEDSKDLEFELEDESEGESEDSEDLEFEPEDESEDESESDSESEEDTTIPRQHIFVSKKDIEQWKRTSLQALNGKQIAEMPIVQALFYRLTRPQQLRMIRRALGISEMEVDSYIIEDEDALYDLLGYLESFLEPDAFIRRAIFLHRRTDPLIDEAVASMNNSKNPDRDLWQCLRRALSCWRGYTSVWILAPEFSELSVEEREEIENDAFAKLNKEDQNSTLLR